MSDLHARASQAILDDDFLSIRARILEIAASLDRYDRAADSPAEDPRRARIDEAIGLLLAEGDDRAKRVQLHFSRPYNAGWRKEFGI